MDSTDDINSTDYTHYKTALTTLTTLHNCTTIKLYNCTEYFYFIDFNDHTVFYTTVTVTTLTASTSHSVYTAKEKPS